jgi:hypothetical protein
MNGKTNKMRRRLSVLALAVSIAAVAIPAATGGGRYEAGLVPSKLGSPDPRDTAQNQTFSPSVVDGVAGSLDPGDSAAPVLEAPNPCAVHLYPCGVVTDESFSKTDPVSSDILRDAA